VSDLTEIRDASRAFIAEREWQQFQDPKSILLALVGEVGELAELLQWLPADVARDRLREDPLHTRVSEEMADVLVYLVGLADQCGVDLGSAALAKIKASAGKYPTDRNLGIAPNKM
jgi:dCTP diphosphatase